MRHLIIALCALCLLAGCVAPLRSDPSAFNVVQSGQIQSSKVQAFTDCLMDGFSEAHFITTNVSVRQQRRAECYRVEALTNTAILMSADIFDDGRVVLFESSVAALIDTSGERKAAADCLDRFQKGE